MKAPPASSENARNTMLANRRVSGLERRLRSALWAAGARGHRVQTRLVGKPDLVFPVERIAVLVHGCFWHGCVVCQLPRPKANADFWAAKLDGNAERDQKVQEQLREQGWEVVVVWEHALRADIHAVAAELLHLRALRRSVTERQNRPRRAYPPKVGNQG